ncbi:hypothetical protein [Paenibacillus lautus]|uniref:hypothetical protein n=1 Tax=Paenibacillus lautus TaxID=1401 RepID=UPI001C7D3A37|nr:hypothetical protein [Paenibacillus lautus]
MKLGFHEERKGDGRLSELVAVKDIKKEVEFWLNALSNPNIDKESILLLNKSLQMELRLYIEPQFIITKRESTNV